MIVHIQFYLDSPHGCKTKQMIILLIDYWELVHKGKENVQM